VRDLGKELQQVKSALSIAARSLSRELTGGGAAESGPQIPAQRRPESYDRLHVLR
jgi:hypothetical protein